MIKTGFRNILIIFVIFLSWHLFAIMYKSILLPEPFTVLAKIYNNLESVKLNLLYSVFRLVSALSITFGIGVLMGILLGTYPRLNKILSPLVYMSYPIPKMALLPFVMILFGFGESTKIIMIVLITVFPVVINVRDEIINIESEVFDVMISLGSSKLQVIKNIVLPGVLPTILTTLRISTGIALSILFFVENYGTKYGLGYSIMDYWMRGDYAGVYGSVILISLLGIIIYKIIDLLGLRLCVWKKKGEN